MHLINCLLILISLIILPVFAGIGLSRILRIRIRLSGSFVLGYLLTWTVIQLLGVPVTLGKGSFRFIAFTVLAVLSGFAVFGIISMVRRKESAGADPFSSAAKGLRGYFADRFMTVLFILLMALTCFVLFKIIRYYHLDADDTRYVINAVDILRTDKILQTDPTSGTPLALAYGDFYKDLVSSWSVFLAYTGFATGLSPTITAHTVMHVILYILILCVYFMLSDVLFTEADVKEKRQNRMIFMYFVQIIILFGYYSLQSSETFILSRLWQGKSVVAGFGVPLIVLIFIYINKDSKKWSAWIILLMTVVAMCHMSAMGIVISAVMTGTFGLYNAIAKRSIRILILAGICCIPPGVYYMISQMTDYFKYIQQ